MQIALEIEFKGYPVRFWHLLHPYNRPIIKILHYCSPVNRIILVGWCKKKTHVIWKLVKTNLALVTLCWRFVSPGIGH
jgi:hypothetical protein